MTPVPGYSGTPLAKKLGLKDGQRVLFIALPSELAQLREARSFLAVTEAGWTDMAGASGPFDLIHAFVDRREALQAGIPRLLPAIVPDGAIWISWPKKASKVPTDVTEDVIREVVLPIGLVDVKVAAVSDIWSGLKVVIRRELRPSPRSRS